MVLRDIPRSPVPTAVISYSWFPDTALHARQGTLVQESSYSMLWFAAGMFLTAIACCFIPWEVRSFLGRGPKVVYFIAGGFAWGGICVVLGYYIRNMLIQSIIIDMRLEQVSIEASDFRHQFPMIDVIGVQLCKGDSRCFQANLVYNSLEGEIARHCLYCNGSKGPCRRLARQYHVLCGFTILDHIE